MSSYTYCNLKIKRLENMPLQMYGCINRTSTRYYIKVGFAGNSMRTQTREASLARDNTLLWEEDIHFPVSNEDKNSTVTIELKQKRPCKIRTNPCIGSCNISLSELLKRSGDDEVDLQLSSARSGRSIIYVQLELSTKENVARANLKIAEDVTKTIEDNLEGALGRLASYIETFEAYARPIAELNLYSKLAYELVSTLWKGTLNDFQGDESLIRLTTTVVNAFDFVSDVGKLSDKTENFSAVLEKLLEEVIEYARFLKLYIDHGFLRQTFIANAGRRITEFERKFREHRELLDSHIGRNNASKLDLIVQDQALSILKDASNPEGKDGWQTTACLPGTCKEKLDDITDWILSDTEDNILWLYGAAGSGKSTIATTIANTCCGFSLGAVLRFKRGESRCGSILPILAYKLAKSEPFIARHVARAVSTNSTVIDKTIDEQFRILLSEPLKEAATAIKGPIIIIMDALDEYDVDPGVRRTTLEALCQNIPKLPKNFRFLITSRMEDDINAILQRERKTPILMMKLDHESDASRHDVRIYLNHEIRATLGRVYKCLPDKYETQDAIESLANSAAGLFIWASTAVKLIDQHEAPHRELLRLAVNRNSMAGLEGLYSTILRNVVGRGDAVSRVVYQKVVGLIVLAKIPLSIATISKITGLDPNEFIRTLSRLQSIINYKGDQDYEKPLRLFHTSLRDYLLSQPPTDEEPWIIDGPSQNSYVASRCFAVMKDSLCFNMCNVESSWIQNSNVPDLLEITRIKVPSHVEYACLWWAHHLRDAPYDLQLLDRLREHLEIRLLYWFEALSLLKSFVHIASRALLYSGEWVRERDTQLSKFLNDAYALAITFALPVSESFPHIYLSMIPLKMEDNAVAAHYAKHIIPHYQKCFRRDGKKPPSFMQSFERHSDAVLSAEFSFDGTQVATRSERGETYVWDPESARVIHGPFLNSSFAFTTVGVRIVSKTFAGRIKVLDPENGEHWLLDGCVKDVAFVKISSDGTRIFVDVGDGTVVTWDVATGKRLGSQKVNLSIRGMEFSISKELRILGWLDDAVAVWNLEKEGIEFGPFKHPEGPYYKDHAAVALSGDGKKLAVGYYSRAVIVWSTESGEVIRAIEGTGEIYSVSFSLDGNRVAAGTASDCEIVIWDIAKGEIVTGPLREHTFTIGSIRYSHDGTRIISGSYDHTAKIWNTRTGRVEDDRRTYQRGRVSSLTYSPDGNRILSGSWDKTAVLWDSQSAEVLLGPLGSWVIWSVAVSPDGRHFVTGNADSLVMWDMETGQIVWGPPNARERDEMNDIFSISFSRDGARIISGDGDGSATVWDAQTGEKLYGPHKKHIIGCYCPVAFSADNEVVVSGGGDGSVKVWNVRTGEGIAEDEPKLHLDGLLSVAFSFDSKYIASGAHDGRLIVREFKNDELICIYQYYNGVSTWSVTFFPNGTWVAANRGQRIIVHDLDTRSIRHVFEGHTSPVYSISVSPDGTNMATGAEDGTMRVWDVAYITGSKAAWTMSEEGWIYGTGSSKQPLLWIPPELRQTLWRPENTLVFSCRFSTKLNLTQFPKHGEWKSIFNGAIA